MRPIQISSFGLPLALGLLVLAPVRAQESEARSSERPIKPGSEVLASSLSPDSTGALVLREALALALARNPELAAHSWEVRAREAARLQAGLLPNPQAELDIEDVAGAGDFRGARRAQTTLRLSQIVELGGKRSARVAAASSGAELATGEYDQKRVEVLADVSEKFVHVLGDQHTLELQRQAAGLAEATLGAVEQRVRAGRVSSLEDKKARVALARARIAEEHAEHELASARRRLAATWDDSTPSFTRVEGDLFLREALPPYEAIAGRIASSPEVVRSLAEISLRRAEIQVEETKRIPDPSLIGGLRRLEESDSQVFVFGLGIPLPTFDRNQGGIAEARALHRKAEETRRTVEASLNARLYGLYQEVLHAQTEMETMEREIVPHATEALKISKDGFDLGKFSFLELLDAQRTFLEVKNEHIRAATRYHRFRTRIERMIGGSL